MRPSNSVENYIKEIFNTSGEKMEWVNTSLLAGKMNIKPSSVTDMIKKLDEKKLVKYKRYKGVVLTEKGNKLALRVIRNHRLWEVFLHNRLKFGWEEIHDIAEQLEHISSRELIKRLDHYLDFPEYDPHGDPIPDHEGKIKVSNRHLLSEFEVGESGKLVGVEDSTSLLKFLKSIKLHLGSIIAIKKKFEFDGSMEIKVHRIGHSINISKEVSNSLYLTRNE